MPASPSIGTKCGSSPMNDSDIIAKVPASIQNTGERIQFSPGAWAWAALF